MKFCPLEKSLYYWRDYLSEVILSINLHSSKNDHSTIQQLVNFFTRNTVFLPQALGNVYKFQKNDNVIVNVPPMVRKSLKFKFSLNFGKMDIYKKGKIIGRNLYVTKNGLIVPFYKILFKDTNEIKVSNNKKIGQKCCYQIMKNTD